MSLGESFTSKAYGGRIVPYEIRVRVSELNVRVSNSNRAKRYVLTGTFDNKLQLQEENKWSKEPQPLADNDAYARMSPAEAVKACFDAYSKLDWAEMRKFLPEEAVGKTQRQVEAAVKQGMDVRKQLPVMEVGEAFWSAEHAAWFVKCHASQVRKHNLPLRKDNPAGRWQVDGGL